MISILNDKILNALGTEKVPRVIVGNKTDLILERYCKCSAGELTLCTGKLAKKKSMLCQRNGAAHLSSVLAN
jgi:GTPase SAR1 family protein